MVTISSPARGPNHCGTELKATIARGYAVALKQAGLFEAVLARGTPRARDLLLNPPASTTWLDAAHVEEIVTAIEAVGGLRACRTVTREASLATQIPVLTTLLTSLLRLFGTSPHTLLSRMHDNIKLTNRGTVIEYTYVSDRSCRVRASMPARARVPLNVFYTFAGGMELIFLLCGTLGTVSDPVLVQDGRHNAADFDLRW